LHVAVIGAWQDAHRSGYVASVAGTGNLRRSFPDLLIVSLFRNRPPTRRSYRDLAAADGLRTLRAR
jgi:hypothetical protein